MSSAEHPVKNATEELLFFICSCFRVTRDSFVLILFINPYNENGSMSGLVPAVLVFMPFAPLNLFVLLHILVDDMAVTAVSGSLDYKTKMRCDYYRIFKE